MKIKKLLKLNQAGFGHIEVGLALVVILFIAVAGMYVGAHSGSHALSPLSDSQSPIPVAYNYTILTLAPTTLSYGISTVDTSKNTVNIAGPSSKIIYGPVQYSPSGDYLAWTSSANKGTLYVKNLATSKVSSYKSPIYSSVGVFINGYVLVPMKWYPNSSKLVFATASSGSANDEIYTVNSNGSDLEAVPNTSNVGTSGLTVTGNEKYIVYGTSNDGVKPTGVYAVHPGSEPISISSTNCTNPESRPGTPQAVSYICESTTPTTETSSVVYRSIGSPATILYSSTINNSAGSSGYFFQSSAWSNDGENLTVEAIKMTYSANCQSIPTEDTGIVAGTYQTQIATINFASPSKLTILAEDTPTQVDPGGCYLDESGELLAYSPDDSNIGYIDLADLPGRTTDSDHTTTQDNISVVPSSGNSSAITDLTSNSLQPTFISW